MLEKIIFDLSSSGRQGHALPQCDVPERSTDALIPKDYLKARDPELPQVAEIDAFRHFVRLSTLNHHGDKGFYPLGSCTMKYNPKVNEDLSRLPGFTGTHPLQDQSDLQGGLKLMKELGDYLCQISGLDAITLQPVAGAHGEYTAIMMIRAYHLKKGKVRSKILVPDSAHGTNPATATLSGYQAITIKSNADGLVDPEDLKAHLDDEVAGLMLTNPNTLGLFEKNIVQVTKMVHDIGGLVFMDGANLNALMGIVRPGDFGIDAMHFNLHKTFATPHGGGGPGGGGVACTKALEPFLPVPVVREQGSDDRGLGSKYYLDYDRPDSIGKVHSFFGNFGVMVKAYAYIRMLGARGLRRASENAIINANYIMRSLEGTYDLPFKAHCKHECVFSGLKFRDKGVKTLDIAKRLLDYGYHAPTIYFPLIVPEAIMIEPTETESQETLDQFIEAMKKIAQEIETDPEIVKSAPNNTPIGRLDDVKAVKEPRLRYGGVCK
ncbi:aminomethyl-transferring glycine dehydrogenase subunit GcvPB [candidate division TA06 bacterium]|uniref:Probable glycine dehydrogenase (decarboxylating) subunit 2 n=1 Tax=candidate division TA06 bacterium TaxID=2250710 RepID=A0A933IC13_UNCT6|nr:aminomethyl-transferring glycine dehydrogenase subunit GcvPB [candidate division TA06 bacterium]